MFWMLAASLFAALGGLILYFYFWRCGQFKDEELVKYQIFWENHLDN